MHPTTANTLPPAQLLETAKQQRRVLWLVVASIPLVIASMVIPTMTGPEALMLTLLALLLVGMVAIGVLGVVAVYRLARALQVSAPWIYVACAFIPYISTFTLLIINHRASAALKRGGIRVGLMGADRGDLLRIGTAMPQSVPANTR